MKQKLVLLATAALLAMLILVPTGVAQEETTAEPLPETGGLVTPSVLLPAAALLVSSGVLTYTLVQRRSM